MHPYRKLAELEDYSDFDGTSIKEPIKPSFKERYRYSSIGFLFFLSSRTKNYVLGSILWTMFIVAAIFAGTRR